MFKMNYKRIMAFFLCGAVVLSAVVVPQSKAEGEDSVDTSDWQKCITIDFGVTEANKDTVTIEETGESVVVSDLALESQLQLKKEFGNDFEMAEPKEMYGNMMYQANTVQKIYGTEASVEQKIGFDKIVPAGKVGVSCGEYFRDWVFSPDGEEYSFSVDLPVGQYYVNVYTGNKVKGYDNTTCIQFNDEAYMVGEKSEPVYYEQTSVGGRQFYIPNRDNNNSNDKVTSYIVDVKDNGKGYGTLKTTLFDNTNNEASHLVKASDVFTPSEDKDVGIKVIERYKGSDAEISEESIADKVITARLNGIEIAPVENPVHAAKFEADAVEVELEDIRPIVIDMGAGNVTDRVFYCSSNPEVVDVDNYYGEVTAKGVGEATIYAYNAYLDMVKVIPYNIIARKTIELQSDDTDNDELLLIYGEVGREASEIVAKTNLADTDIVEWSVGDDTIVRLGNAKFAVKNGEATSTVKAVALKSGSTTITAKRKDNQERIASMSVVVVNATKSVIFTDKDGKALANDVVLEVEAGSSIKTGYLVGPENASNKEVYVECDNESLVSATISDNMVEIKGKKAGETTVNIYTRYSKDINASVKVKVKAKAVVSTPTPTPTQTPIPSPTNAPSIEPTQTPETTVTPTVETSVAPLVTELPGSDSNAQAQAQEKKLVKLSGKAKINLARNKSVVLKVSANGTVVKKVSCKIKSGKKLVKVTASKKKVKITAKRKGTVKVIITVDAKGISKKFTRTIKIK